MFTDLFSWGNVGMGTLFKRTTDKNYKQRSFLNWKMLWRFPSLPLCLWNYCVYTKLDNQKICKGFTMVRFHYKIRKTLIQSQEKGIIFKYYYEVNDKSTWKLKTSKLTSSKRSLDYLKYFHITGWKSKDLPSSDCASGHFWDNFL